MWATDKKASAIFSQHLIIKLFANVFKEIINFRNNCYVQTCGASPHLGVLHALTHLHTNSLPIIYRIRSNIIEIVHSKSYCDFKRNPYLRLWPVKNRTPPFLTLFCFYVHCFHQRVAIYYTTFIHWKVCTDQISPFCFLGIYLIALTLLYVTWYEHCIVADTDKVF